jgi:hypothetical protein
MHNRPSENEYGGHFGAYVRLVPEGNIVETLAAQERDTLGLLNAVPDSRGDFRYAEGKWSVKEIFGHIIDTERVMSYRLLRIARGDETPLPGFDQDLFMKHSVFGQWSFTQLAEDYSAVRKATLTLLKGLPEEAWSRRGTASGVCLTVRALAYVIAGHERHHVAILRDKYSV